MKGSADSTKHTHNEQMNLLQIDIAAIRTIYVCIPP